MQQIDIGRFYTKYVPDPNDPSAMIGIDYVEYGPFGALDRSKTVEKVSRLASIETTEDTDNLAVLIARKRWSEIEPRYKAWKEGREYQGDGTPLAAWNLLSHEDAEIFRVNRIFTVEQIAALTDTHMRKLAMPNIRDLVEQAKLFLASADRGAVAVQMKSIEDENAALKARLEELEKAVLEKPRGPGRPRKETEEAA